MSRQYSKRPWSVTVYADPQSPDKVRGVIRDVFGNPIADVNDHRDAEAIVKTINKHDEELHTL